MDRKLLNGRFKVSSLPHICSLCRSRIPLATRYKIITSVGNGRIYSFLLCDTCCKKIGYIMKYGNIDISKQLNYYIDSKDTESIKKNKEILNQNVRKYCMPMLGNTLKEVDYYIQNNSKNGSDN